MTAVINSDWHHLQKYFVLEEPDSEGQNVNIFLLLFFLDVSACTVMFSRLYHMHLFLAYCRYLSSHLSVSVCQVVWSSLHVALCVSVFVVSCSYSFVVYSAS